MRSIIGTRVLSHRGSICLLFLPLLHFPGIPSSARSVSAFSPSNTSIPNGNMASRSETVAVFATDDKSTASANECKKANTRHICFLVHGWMGNEGEMSSMEHSILRRIDEVRDNFSGESIEVVKSKCNNEDSNDGIVKGGRRLVEEFKKHLLDSPVRGEDDTITVSFIGNSLGGLYSRYAIAELFRQNLQRPSNSSSVSLLLDDTTEPVTVRFNAFCTTATPHLGVASNTYIPIPRALEVGAASLLGNTLKDLFRADETEDIILQMATDPDFLTPLSLFETRMAYANAFSTDFQVPLNTAAFLDAQSAHPHEYVESGVENEFVVGTFVTRDFHRETMDDGSLRKMSESLDSLGWTKVFIDTRSLLPFPGIKSPFRENGRDRFRAALRERQRGNDKGDGKVIFESKELARLLSQSETINFPLGHTVMVANSKNKLYRRMNSGGTVVMDYFAAHVVDRIYSLPDQLLKKN